VDRKAPADNSRRQPDSELYVVAAAARAALIERCERLRQFAASNPLVGASDLSYAINCPGPEPTEQRIAIVAASPDELIRKLDHARERLTDPNCHRIKDVSGIYFFESLPGAHAQLAFLFPGEGAQYVGMFADLCMRFREVREWFDLMDRAFQDHPRGFLPSEVIFPVSKHGPAGDAAQGLFEMESAIEAVFAANQAMHALLTGLGIHADAVVGHSTGEFSALLACQAVKPADDAELISQIREGNRITDRALREGKVPPGVLLSVAGSNLDALEAMSDRSRGALHLAMDNCPNQGILCGTEEAVSSAERELRANGAICLRLPFSRAYHTPMYSRVRDELRAFYDAVTFSAPLIPCYSCATAQPMPLDPAAARSLALDQWTRRVRFRETIEAMYAADLRIFLEVGPRGNLTGFVDDILGQRPHLAVASNVQARSGTTQLHHMLGLLIAYGIPLTLDPLYADRGSRRLSRQMVWNGVAMAAERSQRAVRLSLALPILRLDGTVPSKPAAAATTPTRIAGLQAADPPPRPQPWRRPLFDEYLQTMERFMQVQKTTMQAFLAAAPSNGFTPRFTTPRTTYRGYPDLPFVSRVNSEVAGEEVAVTTTLDPTTDAFLRDHALGPRISDADPDLLPLPVLPLALAVEVMAEVASLLVPGSTLSGVRDVRASRWITVPGPRCLEVRAKRVNGAPGHVEVRVLDPGNNERADQGDRLPLVQGLVVFGDLPSRSRAPAFELVGRRRCSWNPSALYGEGHAHGMFHGPTFRGVVSIDAVGENGAEATLRRSSDEASRLIAQPLVLDAAGQVAGFWAADVLERASVVFPVGFRRLSLYAADPPSRFERTSHVRITELKENKLTSDIVVADGAGDLVLQVQGWEDKRFDLPARLFAYRLDPKHRLCGVPWPLPAGNGQAQSVTGCRLQLPDGLLSADANIWRDILAHIALSRGERDTWTDLRGNAGRRAEWLLGRVAAKDAVRVLLREKYGLDVYPADVVITADANQQPHAEGFWSKQTGTPVAISIAHSRGTAIAIACDAPGVRGAGVDLEGLDRSRIAGEAIAGPQEQEFLDSLPGKASLEWPVRLWCAKEAAAKALGVGLVAGPGSLALVNAECETGIVRLAPVGALAERFPELAGTGVSATTYVDESLAYALAVF
jgi:malonyl CoA-acyl carrier protein transacylase/phosphopantetheinyl transferase (holo-ACP synthase)